MALVFMIILAFFVIEQRMRRIRTSYFLTHEDSELISRVYANYAEPMGLNGTQFERCLKDPRMPTHHFQSSKIHTLFAHTVKTYGAVRIPLRQLRLTLCDLIETSVIPPYPNTPSTTHGVLFRVSAMENFFHIARFDGYNDAHRNLELGEQISIVKTDVGGAATFITRTALVCFLGLLVSIFTFQNILETRAVLPSHLVGHADVVTLMNFTVTTKGTDTTPSFCIVNGKCAPELVVTSSGILIGSAAKTYCSLNGDICAVTWVCPDCTVYSSESDLGVVNFTFHPSWFSTETTMDIAIHAGVPEIDPQKPWEIPQEDTISSASLVFDVEEGYAFKGYPATQASFLLTPTVFSTPAGSWSAQTVRGDGYHHIKQEKDKTLGGNVVSGRSFGDYYGVPVQVLLSPTSSTLVVTRYKKQQLLDLIVSILGSWPGIVGPHCG